MTVLVYGSHQHASQEVSIQETRERVYDDRNVAVTEKHKYVVNGRLEADSQAALVQAIATLRNAYATGNQNLKLLADDGTDLGFGLDAASSVSGVRITRPPAFGDLSGGQLVSWADYTIELEAEYLLSSTGLTVTEYTETVNIIGDGGPKRIIKPGLYQCQPQITQLRTAVRVEQTGSAAQIGTWPQMRTPLLASAWLQRPDGVVRNYGHPRVGRFGVLEYPINWRFVFESTTDQGGVRPKVLLT